MGGMGGDTLTDQQKKILAYAVRGSGGAKIVLAVEGGAMSTSAYILDSDAVVIGMGGFSGQDDAPSVGRLQNWVSAGELRYVLGSGQSQQSGQQQQMAARMGFGGGAAQERSTWISAHCTEVPAADYGGTETESTAGGLPFGGSTLYDCAPTRAPAA
jgi:hypothetical protein